VAAGLQIFLLNTYKNWCEVRRNPSRQGDSGGSKGAGVPKQRRMSWLAKEAQQM